MSCQSKLGAKEVRGRHPASEMDDICVNPGVLPLSENKLDGIAKMVAAGGETNEKVRRHGWSSSERLLKSPKRMRT